jgi:PAS domain S-box-containing protein
MSILIYHIEDNLGDQIIVQRYLKTISRWKTNLVPFKRLTDAFDRMKVEEPDLILLDLSLPDASNLKGLEAILALYPEACVVVLTANLRKDLAYAAIKIGAEDFINKENLRPDDLERTLGFSFERNKLKRENYQLKKDASINVSRLNGFDSAHFSYIIRTDLKGNYTYVNNLFKDTFLKAREDVIGLSSLSHIYHEDQPSAIKTVALAMLKPGQVYSVILRKPLTIPGLIKTTYWDFIALTDQNGSLIEIQCTGYDLTEQNKNQLENQRIKKVNELILSNSGSLSMLLDEDFKVEYEIGNHARIFESYGVLVGRYFEEFLHPSDLEIWRRLTYEVINEEKEIKPIKIRVLDNNNIILWVNISMNFVGNENQTTNGRYSLVIRDINDEHLSEISTLYNEKKYRALFENNPSIIITADFKTGKILEVNKAFEEKLKIISEQSLGKTVEELKIWKNTVALNSFIRKLAANGDHRLTKLELKCADGTALIVNLHGIIINLNNQLLKILIAEDISAEVKLSNQLKNQEEIYRGLVDNSNDLYLVLDKDSNIIFGSPQLSSLNYKPENIINTSFNDYIGSSHQAYIKAACADTWQAKTISSSELKPFQIINRFGSPKWFCGRISYLKNFPQQKEGVIVCYLNDIHKEYQLEKERDSLHEQTLDIMKDLEQYKSALDKHALVALMDPQGIFLYANEYFCSANGYSASELMGKSTSILNSNYHSSSFYKNLWNTVKAGKIWQGEFRNRRKDGSLYWAKTTIASRLDENTGEIINYISIHTDVTELKRMHQDLYITKSNLSNTLNSINQSVWSVNKDYELTIFNKLFHSNFKSFFNYDLKTKQNMLEIIVLPQEVTDNFKERYDLAFKGEVASYFDEYIDPRDQINKYFEIKVHPTVDEIGEIIGATVFSQDITERTEKEKELKELLIRFELATKSNNIGIWDYDIVNNKLTWDDSMFELYEIDNKVEISWAGWTNLLTEESVTRNITDFEEALKSKTNFSTSYKVRVKNGTKSISDLSRIIRDENGKAIRAIGLNWDISKNVQYEEDLRHSLKEKKEILSSINDGLLVLDQQMLVRSVNKSACKILNIKEDEILGKSLWPQSQDKVLSAFYPVFKRCLDTNTGESVIALDNETKKWIDACAYPQFDGLAIFFKDISIERSKTLELEKAQNNQAALINTTLDLIWSLNTNLEFVAFNNQFSRHQSLIGSTIPIEGSSIFGNSSESYISEWKLRYDEALSGEIVSETISENNLIYTISLYPIINADNEIEGIACYARDMTDTEAYRNAIELQNDELKEIAWMQSHIIRAPVARILGLIELINDEKLSTSQELSDYLKNIDASANELDQTIEKITKKTYSSKIKGI